jgi:hypothetical protein
MRNMVNVFRHFVSDTNDIDVSICRYFYFLLNFSAVVPDRRGDRNEAL